MKRLQISAIVGATHINSNTLYFVSKFIQILSNELDNQTEFKLFNLCKYRVDNCSGCCRCLRAEKCCKKDHMELLKQVMLASDLIIWASPVYMNGVSGIMKTFIDRLHSWTKSTPLHGKFGIILSSSSHKINSIYIKDYLIWIQNSLGMTNIGAYNICVDAPKELYSKDSQEIIQQYVFETIIDYRLKFETIISQNKY